MRIGWPGLALLGILLVCAMSASGWVDRNGIPDGFQNESIHVRNAMDLWQSIMEGDGYTFGQVVRTYYWPPGFYAWPIPWYGWMGTNHAAMISANLGHLAVLLAAVYLLGRELSDRAGGVLAAALVALYPSILGNLVRFEPNVAVTAWVTLGAYCLLKSRGYEDRRWSVLFGLACGVGLLMDRLSLAVFLALPAVVIALTGALKGRRSKARAVNASLALAVLLAVAGWWLVSFYQVNVQELKDQGGLGEIDAAGTWTEQRDFTALRTWAYYATVLLDEQAGLIPGAAALAGLCAALVGRVPRRERLVPVLVVVSSVALFTLVAKKQVYYTIPILGCLAALTAAWLRSIRWGWGLALVIVLAGVHQAGWRLWERGLPLPGPVAHALGDQVLPASWTDRRHVQARPPRNLALPIDEMARAIGAGSVVVMSEDATWPEGFVVLQLRERLPGVWIRGMSNDPYGTYEQARAAESVIWVTPREQAGWPTLDALEAILINDNYALADLPPVADTLAELEDQYGVGGRWALPYGGSAVVFRAR